MITAAFHGQVIARSEQTVYLEGNHYFPRESLVPDALEDSWVRTLCFWKGVAFYRHVRAGGPPVTERRLVLSPADTPGPDDQRPRRLRSRRGRHRQRRPSLTVPLRIGWLLPRPKFCPVNQSRDK